MSPRQPTEVQQQIAVFSQGETRPWQEIISDTPEQQKIVREENTRISEIVRQAEMHVDDEVEFFKFVETIATKDRWAVSRELGSKAKELFDSIEGDLEHEEGWIATGASMLTETDEELSMGDMAGQSSAGGATAAESAFKQLKKLLSEYDVHIPVMPPSVGPSVRDVVGMEGYRVWKGEVVELGRSLLDSGRLTQRHATSMSSAIEKLGAATNVTDQVTIIQIYR